MSTTKTSGQRPVLAAPSISFKRELEELRAQRRVPAVERHLTIGGGIEQAVHSQEDRKRETRINAIEKALHEIKGRAAAEFTLSGLKNRASRDFDRER